MLTRMWRKGNICTLLVGMYIDTATTENNLEAPQNIKNRIYHMIPQCYFWIYI